MSELWWFELIDSDKIFPLSSDDLVLCSENIQNLEPNFINLSDIMGTSKNEVIDVMIEKLQRMKNAVD